jgi:hypothetical protein
MAWCFLVYPSPMLCPTQVWGGTMVNLYCWINSFAYSGWGAPQVFAYWHVDQTYMAKEDAIQNGLCASKFYQIFILSDHKSRRFASYFENKITHEINCFRTSLVLLVRQAPPKGRGHVLNTKSGGRSGPRARTVRAPAIRLTQATILILCVVIHLITWDLLTIA